MKKIFLVCMLSISLFSDIISRNNFWLSTDYLVYYVKDDKCNKFTYSESFEIVKGYNNGILIINGDIVKWSNGATFIPMQGKLENTIYDYYFFNDIEICKEFIRIRKENQ